MRYLTDPNRYLYLGDNDHFYECGWYQDGTLIKYDHHNDVEIEKQAAIQKFFAGDNAAFETSFAEDISSTAWLSRPVWDTAGDWRDTNFQQFAGVAVDRMRKVLGDGIADRNLEYFKAKRDEVYMAARARE